MCLAPSFRTFTIPEECRDIIFPALKEIYAPEPFTRLSKIGNHQMMVWSSPIHHKNIEKQIILFTEALTELEKIKPKKQDQESQETFLSIRQKVLGRLKTIAILEVNLMILEDLTNNADEQQTIRELSMKVAKLRADPTIDSKKKSEK
jgi:hypothetical protein